MPATFRNITPRVVAELARGNVSAPANTFVRDTALPGFAIRVGRTKSSFVFEGRTGRSGRVVRYTLGTVGRLELDEARTQAKEKIGELARGADPVAALRAQRGVAITLRQALELLAGRDIKASTLADYERSLIATGWMDRRLSGIKPADVLALYDARREHPTSTARILRSFRSVWNAAKAQHPTLPACPTSALRDVRRKWATAPRKRRLVGDAALPLWRQQVAALKHEGVRDLILFLHYTGCRIGETRALTAGDVDLNAGTFTLADPKNGNPVTLPLVKQTRAILARRLAAADQAGHLFPQYDVRRLHASVNAAPWSPHDLRRGYITIAHRIGVDNEHARRLTNHAASGDAHDGYYITDPDALRPDAQRIADHFDRLARRRPARASTQ